MVQPKGELRTQILLTAFVCLLCLSMVYPFIHILSISFSTPAEAIRPGIHIYPLEFSVEAYKTAFRQADLWYGYANSVFRAVVGTALHLIAMLLTAYPLAKKTLPHRTFFTMVIVLTMFFSGGLIPTYMLIKSLGLYDNRWVYILPMLINTFSLLVLRNFIMALPKELEDSAKIDGAHELRILFSIVVPLSLPALATVGLWSAVRHWNAWFDALIYIESNEKQVVQVYLRRLIIDNSIGDVHHEYGLGNVTPESIRGAALILTITPILLVFPFLQKYFVRGIMIGSVKG